MKTVSFVRDPKKVILLAPLVFLLHVLEEYRSVVSWVNSVLKQGSMSQSLFIAATFLVLFCVILVTIILNKMDSTVPAFIALVLLSSVMLANGIFHIIASAMVDTNPPGVITSIFLLLPFFIWFTWVVMKRYKIRLLYLLLAVLWGSVPMVIHGYFLLFRGRHIFFG